jgi:DNA-binding XRE family transcriptional regulator
MLIVCGVRALEALALAFKKAGNSLKKVLNGSHNRRRTPERVAFGKRVREKRTDLRLTQEELAERADLHTTYLSSVERGERNIALENIIAIALALGCSPKDLMPE